jgi:membrane-bound metal-dependent hydrolase YbcI (DUF457 family)
MTSRTHNAIALASLITISAFYPPESINLSTLIGVIVANNIGGLIPDMDTGGNYLWGLLPQGKFLGKFLRKIFYKHRTITHSLLGLFLIYNFLNFVLPKLLNTDYINTDLILASLMIGFISHLVSDSFTEEGIPLLFPSRLTFGIPPIRKIRIKTGQWFENVIIFPGIWIYLFWFVQKYQNVFLNMLRMIK